MEQEQIGNDEDRGGSGGSEQHGESRGSTRPPGTTTSAMVRDAARLRTVMTRATRQEGTDESSTFGQPGHGTRTELHGGRSGAIDPAIGIPLPDLDAVRHEARMEDDIPVPAAEPDHHRLESSGYGATRLVMPPAATTGGGRNDVSEPSAPTAGRDGATRLRPVAALNTTKPYQSAVSGAAMPVHVPAAEAAMATHTDPVRQTSMPSERKQAAPLDMWDAAATAATPKIASDSWSSIPRENRVKRTGGFRKGVAAACTVVAGSVIGIGLYVSGGGFLSGIFSNKTEGVQMMSPSTVTERPQVITPQPVAPVTADSMIAAAVTGTTPIAPSVAAPVVSEEHAPSPAIEQPPVTQTVRPVQAPPVRTRENRPVPATSTAPVPRPVTVAESSRNREASGGETRPNAAVNARRESGEIRETRAVPVTRTESAPSNVKYVVQVRATPDEAEANLVARKLRKKGVSNVQVVRSEKNGAPFYRVRFVGTGSSGAARDKAKGAGYADVWVVKQD